MKNSLLTSSFFLMTSFLTLLLGTNISVLRVRSSSSSPSNSFDCKERRKYRGYYQANRFGWFDLIWLACAKSARLSPRWPWFDTWPGPSELSWVLVLCCATRVFQTIQFSSLGKNRTLPILAVLRGHDVAGSQRRPCMPASQTLIIKPMKRSLCK